jgi:hypothetical protein
MKTHRFELRLPPRFWDDHQLRECEIGAGIPEAEHSVEIRRVSNGVIVSMTEDGIRELWSDADYYASEMGAEGHMGLASSARATLKAIRAGHAPAADYRLDPRIRL